MVLILAFLLVNCSGGEAKAKNAVVLNPESIDLGTIQATEKVKVEFELINHSDEQRKIISHAQSCGCTKLTTKTKILRAHQTLKVALIFDPERESGRFEKSAFLRLDNNEIMVFKFKGTVGK